MAGNGIIVGVDASADARAALWWAVDEARLRGSTLLLVHAAAHNSAELAGVGVRSSRRAHDHAGESLLAECAVEASHRQPGVLITRVLSQAAAADELIALSAEAELLVLGTRGRIDSFDTILGSVSHHVAAHAGCPVVLVADSPTVQPKSGAPGIVVAVSDAPEDRLALAFAFHEAQRRGAGIVAVSGGPLPAEGLGADQPTLTAARSRHYGALLEAQLAPWRRQFPGVVLRPAVDAGGILDTLLCEADRAQLMVLGCEHRSAGWSNRLGAVPTAMVGRAACPVVLIGSQLATVTSRSAVV
jgi:nucleotide-binding universal stress UspA family protein